MPRRLIVLVAFLIALVPGARAGAQPGHGGARGAILGTVPRPRLVVVISIDQLRADYLVRFADLLLPPEAGGFRRLMEQGAAYVNAHHNHFLHHTGPGHAVILTGAYPYKSGIVGNQWWDPVAGRIVYCVGDPQGKVVGAADDSRAQPMGPRNLQCSTVGDELKLATAGRAKVVSLGLKDRGAVLMAGHAADACLWFDAAGARWISSTAYCPSGELPAWVRDLNAERLPDRALGTRWEPVVDAETLTARTFAPAVVGGDLSRGFNREFPHAIGKEATRASYSAFEMTPAANDFVLESAARALSGAGLGQDDVPDLLAIGLSTNDYVGHVFGPNSPEALDLLVRTDAALARFLGELDRAVPGGLGGVLVVLTADHGVGSVPEDAAGERFRLPAGRYSPRAVVEAVGAGLTARYGEPEGASWFSEGAGGSRRSGAFVDGGMWLSPGAVGALIAGGKASSRLDVERTAREALAAARVPGVYGCFGRSQVLEGALADNALKRQLSNVFHPARSPDLIVLAEQNYLMDAMPGGNAASHATPYTYDSHVPVVLFGPAWVRAGAYTRRVSTADMAPTLAMLLGTELPSGCDGEPLREALGE